jgi:hypothetical protein
MHVKQFVPLLASMFQIISVFYHYFWYLCTMSRTDTNFVWVLKNELKKINVYALHSIPILEVFFQQILKDHITWESKNYDTSLTQEIWEDTPKTAGREGVMGKTKSHTVMLNYTQIQGGDWDSSSISIFPKSPQLADSKGDWRTWCNPLQINCSASIYSRSTIAQSAPKILDTQ